MNTRNKIGLFLVWVGSGISLTGMKMIDDPAAQQRITSAFETSFSKSGVTLSRAQSIEPSSLHEVCANCGEPFGSHSLSTNMCQKGETKFKRKTS